MQKWTMARTSSSSDAEPDRLAERLPDDDNMFSGDFRRSAPVGRQRRVTINGRELPTHTDLCRHGDGFAWGYDGSGPAQLALAILVEATDDRALALVAHQRFKREVISELGQEEPWSMSAATVREWVRTQLKDGSISPTEVQRQRDAAGP